MKKVLILLTIILFLSGCTSVQLMNREEILESLKSKYKEEFDIKKIEYSNDYEVLYIVNPKNKPTFNFYVKNYIHSDGPVGFAGRKSILEDNYTVDKYYHEFSKYLYNNNIKYRVSDIENFYNSINYIISFNETNYKDIANKISYFVLAKKEVFPYNIDYCGYIQFKLEGTEYQSFYETNLCLQYQQEELTFTQESLIKKMNTLIAEKEAQELEESKNEMTKEKLDE